jgi:hypothetical protein
MVSVKNVFIPLVFVPQIPKFFSSCEKVKSHGRACVLSLSLLALFAHSMPRDL